MPARQMEGEKGGVQVGACVRVFGILSHVVFYNDEVAAEEQAYRGLVSRKMSMRNPRVSQEVDSQAQYP